MADDKIQVLGFHQEVTAKTVVMKSIFGCNLRSLRLLVESCEGMPDDSDLWIEDLIKNEITAGRYWFKRMTAESRKPLS